MAGHHSLQTHLPAGCNGASGPGSLDGLSPTLGVDIRSFRVSNRQVKQAYFRAVRNIETRDPPSWLDPTPSWQPLTVGVHSLRGHPVA